MGDFLTQDEVDALLAGVTGPKRIRNKTKKSMKDMPELTLHLPDIFEFVVTLEASFNDEYHTTKQMTFSIYECNSYRANRIATERMLGMHWNDSIDHESVKVLDTELTFKYSGKNYEYVGK